MRSRKELLGGFVAGGRIIVGLTMVSLPYLAYRPWRLLDEVASFQGFCPGLLDSAPGTCTVAEYVERAHGGLSLATVAWEWTLFASISAALWLIWRRCALRYEKFTRDGMDHRLESPSNSSPDA
jgi:hypothetical protein